MLVDRVGKARAAKLLKVSEGTVGDWLRRGVPEKRVKSVGATAERSSRGKEGYDRRVLYQRMGWRGLRTHEDVDKLLGLKRGHTRERWEHRKEWWERNRPDEKLAKRVAFIVDKEGRLLYVNGDKILWRGYTVTGKDEVTRLFWTQATYLDGYDTADEFQARYGSLARVTVQIHFGNQ